MGYLTFICFRPLEGREDGEGEDSDADDVEVEPDSLGITEGQAQFNYERAGKLIPEQKQPINIEDYKDHLLPGVVEELDRLVTKLNIPYELTEFQRVGACVLGSGKSLFLIVPTGEGKLTVGLLASHLLRRIRNQPNAVAVITQPLTREFLLL